MRAAGLGSGERAEKPAGEAWADPAPRPLAAGPHLQGSGPHLSLPTTFCGASSVSTSVLLQETPQVWLLLQKPLLGRRCRAPGRPPSPWERGSYGGLAAVREESRRCVASVSSCRGAWPPVCPGGRGGGGSHQVTARHRPGESDAGERTRPEGRRGAPGHASPECDLGQGPGTGSGAGVGT